MKENNAVDTIYSEREKFIIIGLTGRTGSGCTTVSNILSKKFNNLALHQPKNTDFNNIDERKYQIIYSYAEKHWHEFERISMTDIIFSFIVQAGYKNFMDELEKMFDTSLRIMIEESLKTRNDTFENEFDKLSKKINSCIKDGNLNRDNEEFLEVEYEILLNLPNIQKCFRDVMQNEKFTFTKKDGDKEILEIVNVFTFCLQEFGNRIRHHGNIYNEEIFTEIHMFALARRANDFIKAIRHRNKIEKKHTFICLDAIRNNYEATYFQDRYAAFFLVAVSTDNEERIRRLGKNFDRQQIEALDKTEYPNKLIGDKKFTNQDIGACAQLADIYLYNPKEKTDEKFFITELIVKYVTLIMHPGLVTPTNIERCMQIAYNAKLNSGCLSRQVGAVITDENYSVKAVGWNSVAEGQVPCNLRSLTNYFNNKDAGTFSSYELESEEFSKHLRDNYAYIKENDISVLNGRLFQYCFKDEYGQLKRQKNQVHTRSLHAEENAFLQIVKYGGEGIKGGNLFTSASSCVLCSKKAVQLGIKHIYYIDPYPDIADSHIISFGKDKSNNPQCHLFYGAIGRAYTCLFTQRIAIKDELNYLIDKKD